MAQVETAWPTVRFAVIGDAWRLYRRHWLVWSLTMLVAMVCAAIGAGLAALALKIIGLGILAGVLGLGIVNGVLLTVPGFFLGGMVRMAINQVRGRPPQIEDLFSVKDVWFDLVLGSFLLAVPLVIGLSLFVIPGLIIAGLFMFMFPLIVDGRLPATGAMIQSYHALKSQWLAATMVHLAVAAVAFVGSLCGIGLLVTGPLYALSLAVLYRDLFLDPYSSSSTWTKPHDPYHGDF
jgi:hypothetical protein